MALKVPLLLEITVFNGLAGSALKINHNQIQKIQEILISKESCPQHLLKQYKIRRSKTFWMSLKLINISWTIFKMILILWTKNKMTIFSIKLLRLLRIQQTKPSIVKTMLKAKFTQILFKLAIKIAEDPASHPRGSSKGENLSTVEQIFSMKQLICRFN